MPENCAVILAAGEGKRMRSSKAKVLQEVLFKPMLDWVIDSVKAAGIENICVVTGHLREQVESHLGPDIAAVVQEKRLGTGHAVMQAADWLRNYAGGNCLVLCGDAPLFSAATIRASGEVHCNNRLSATVITAFTSNPSGYGRIIRDGSGLIREIVEERDADEATRAVGEVNGGAYWFDVDLLLPALSSLKNENSQGEYYLTDVPGFFAKSGRKVGAYVAPFEEISCANDRWQLCRLNDIARLNVIRKHMNAGVSIPFTDGVVIGPDAEISPDAVILPGTEIKGKCRIGEGSVIGPNSLVCDSEIGAGCTFNSSQIYSSALGDGVTVGPFVHIRPGSRLMDGVHVGDFVEIKNSSVGEGTKLPHLSYIGDSDVGSGVNCGCGTVTANYDGKNKSRTSIGDGSFIGCHTCLVAPVSLGENAFTAAGSVVTKDVPDGALAIGRGRLEIKENWTPPKDRG